MEEREKSKETTPRGTKAKSRCGEEDKRAVSGSEELQEDLMIKLLRHA